MSLDVYTKQGFLSLLKNGGYFPPNTSKMGGDQNLKKGQKNFFARFARDARFARGEVNVHRRFVPLCNVCLQTHLHDVTTCYKLRPHDQSNTHTRSISPSAEHPITPLLMRF